jgi:hypothetical protein
MRHTDGLSFPLGLWPPNILFPRSWHAVSIVENRDAVVSHPIYLKACGLVSSLDLLIHLDRTKYQASILCGRFGRVSR